MQFFFNYTDNVFICILNNKYKKYESEMALKNELKKYAKTNTTTLDIKVMGNVETFDDGYRVLSLDFIPEYSTTITTLKLSYYMGGLTEKLLKQISTLYIHTLYTNEFDNLTQYTNIKTFECEEFCGLGDIDEYTYDKYDFNTLIINDIIEVPPEIIENLTTYYDFKDSTGALVFNDDVLSGPYTFTKKPTTAHKNPSHLSFKKDGKYFIVTDKHSGETIRAPANLKDASTEELKLLANYLNKLEVPFNSPILMFTNLKLLEKYTKNTTENNTTDNIIHKMLVMNFLDVLKQYQTMYPTYTIDDIIAQLEK